MAVSGKSNVMVNVNVERAIQIKELAKLHGITHAELIARAIGLYALEFDIELKIPGLVLSKNDTHLTIQMRGVEIPVPLEEVELLVDALEQATRKKTEKGDWLVAAAKLGGVNVKRDGLGLKIETPAGTKLPLSYDLAHSLAGEIKVSLKDIMRATGNTTPYDTQ